MRRRLGAGLTAVGLLMGIFGVYAPQAGAANAATPNVSECPNGGLKIDNINGPFNGTYSNNGLTITITQSDQDSFTWQSVESAEGADDALGVAYIIAKGGNDRDRIPASGQFEGDDAFGGSVEADLETKSGGQAAISHVSFCLPGEEEEPGVPSVDIQKDASDESVARGEDLVFSITVTAGGDEGSISENVLVNDDLPPGFDWEITDQTDETNAPCSIDDTDPENLVLSCDLGDMTEGDTYTVEVTAPTEEDASCGDVENTATVTWGEASEDETDESSDSITITGCGGGPIITEDTTTTTTSTTTTTTTVPEEVLGEEVTTTTAPPVEETTTTEATVAGIQLPRTGAETGTLLVLAGVALALGGLLIGASDRAARRLGRERA